MVAIACAECTAEPISSGNKHLFCCTHTFEIPPERQCLITRVRGLSRTHDNVSSRNCHFSVLVWTLSICSERSRFRETYVNTALAAKKKKKNNRLGIVCPNGYIYHTNYYVCIIRTDFGFVGVICVVRLIYNVSARPSYIQVKHSTCIMGIIWTFCWED